MIPFTNRRVAKILIIILVFLLLILALTILGGPGFPENDENLNHQKFDTMTPSLHIYPNTWEERKNATKDLPDIVKNEMDELILYGKFGISKWGVDPYNQQLIVYAYNIQNLEETDNLQNNKIGNWTLRIIHDTEIETETTDVYTEIKRMENTCDLQVESVETAPSEKKVTMWVSNSTPDNQKLNGTQINGWIVEVYLAGLPRSPTANLTNSS